MRAERGLDANNMRVPTRRIAARRKIAASKQSRYLRDTSRAVEALVLSAWYAGFGVVPPARLPESLPALYSSDPGQAALMGPVLAEMLEVASFVARKDTTLGLAQGGVEPPELRAAMCEGISNAIEAVEGIRGLSDLLRLEEMPTRLETFDISHLYGTHTVGACSTLSLGMTDLEEYLCYPVHGVAPADDPGAISAVLRERLGSGEMRPPSVLIIDGGKGQLSAAMNVLSRPWAGPHGGPACAREAGRDHLHTRERDPAPEDISNPHAAPPSA